MVIVHGEEQLRVVVENPADEQRERRLGGLELVAAVLQFLHTIEDLLRLRRVVRELEAEVARLEQNVAAARKVAHKDVALVADQRRVDVLVARGEFLHGVHMRATLVRERRRADPRLARVVPDVGDFIHELGKFLELAQRRGGQTRLAQLQLQAGNDTGHVAIARAFAVAVHRGLHMARTGFDRSQRVRHAKADVVVRVDAHAAVEPADGGLRDGRNFTRQTAAVRVTQHHHVRTRLLGGLPGGDGVFRVELVAVEAMLGVVDDELPVVLEVTHGVADHAEVFVRRAAQDFLHMQHGGLAVDRHHGRLRLDEQAHLIVALNRRGLFPRGAEGGELGVLELAPLGLREELDVLRIAARPAALDVVNPEGVNALGDAELVRDREVDAFTLRAISEGRIVEFDCWFHHIPAVAGACFLRECRGGGKSQKGQTRPRWRAAS